MNNNLSKLLVERKSGEEKFHKNGATLNIKLLQFWQWSVSDVAINVLRGILAEFIVASALDVADGTREEWDAQDVKTKDGIKVEVKSSAYLQSWEQDGFSNINFGIQPTYGWDAETNQTTPDKVRQSDIYVFCVLKHKDKATLDPLNLEQWDFYLLPTRVLNEKKPNQKKLS